MCIDEMNETKEGIDGKKSGNPRFYQDDGRQERKAHPHSLKNHGTLFCGNGGNDKGEGKGCVARIKGEAQLKYRKL